MLHSLKFYTVLITSFAQFCTALDAKFGTALDDKFGTALDDKFGTHST
jgi:hypothetical protein